MLFSSELWDVSYSMLLWMGLWWTMKGMRHIHHQVSSEESVVFCVFRDVFLPRCLYLDSREWSFSRLGLNWPNELCLRRSRSVFFCWSDSRMFFARARPVETLGTRPETTQPPTHQRNWTWNWVSFGNVCQKQWSLMFGDALADNPFPLLLTPQ